LELFAQKLGHNRFGLNLDMSNSKIKIHCNSAKPDELWSLFKNDLAEDFAKKHSIELAYRKAYLDSEKNC